MVAGPIAQAGARGWAVLLAGCAILRLLLTMRTRRRRVRP